MMRNLSRYARVGWCERSGVVVVAALCGTPDYRLTAAARAAGHRAGGNGMHSISMRLHVLGWSFESIYERRDLLRRVEVRGVSQEDAWKMKMPVPLAARLLGQDGARWHPVDLIARDAPQLDPVTRKPIARTVEVREFHFSTLRGRYASRRWFLRGASAVRIKDTFYPETGGWWPTMQEYAHARGLVRPPVFDADGLIVE